MIYLYAFADADADMPDGTGGEGVAIVRHAGVAAVVAPVDAAPEPEPAALWRHEAVVEAVPAAAAVLPARFGTVLGDEADVRALLAQHREVLRAALDRVRGHVEIGVRIKALHAPPTPEPTVVPESGRAYLERRRAERHDLVAAAEAIDERLRAHARAAVRRGGDGRRQLLVGAYLVARDGVEDLVARIRSLPVEQQGLQLVATGPWPPYSFAPVLEEAPRDRSA